MTPAEVIDESAQRPARARRRRLPHRPQMDHRRQSRRPDDNKYVICNADEGDPGAFMDRSVWKAIPTASWKAWRWRGYAVGATEGYIYVRGEYPLAVERLKTAIRQANRWACWATTSAAPPFNFNVQHSPGGRRLCLR
jgi:bidirectional [NiFe] hydrogenase diaphorase subunit